jgi:hypothetical protein
MARTVNPKGNVDIRIIFDMESSKNIRASLKPEKRTIREQIEYIVQQYYKENPHDQTR